VVEIEVGVGRLARSHPNKRWKSRRRVRFPGDLLLASWLDEAGFTRRPPKLRVLDALGAAGSRKIVSEFDARCHENAADSADDRIGWHLRLL